MIIVIAIFVILFGFIVFRGAPYVPTHRRTTKKVMDILNLKKGDLLVDLGSGDGVMLKAAAIRGVRAIGYELNPILCLLAWLRCYRYKNIVSVKCRDFWFTNLPKDTNVVFVFLAGPFMRSLGRKLKREMKLRKKELRVVSYGFEIPNFKPYKIEDNLFFYKLDHK